MIGKRVLNQGVVSVDKGDEKTFKTLKFDGMDA
jgi:hypothetical protein